MSTVGVPKFSDMVGSGSGSSTGGSHDNFKFGTVFKKATSQRRKSQVAVRPLANICNAPNLLLNT